MKSKLFTVFLIVSVLVSIGVNLQLFPFHQVKISDAHGYMGFPPHYYCDNGTIEGIQEGIDNASATGGTVHIPAGAWSFNATDTNFVNVTSCNITIMGAGAFLTNLTLPPDETAYDNVRMFWVLGTDGKKINITGISFFGRIGDNANFTGDTGISLIACKDFQVSNCTFANMGSNGVATSREGYADYYSQGVIWNCSFYCMTKPMAYNNSGLWVRYGASTLNLSEGVWMDKFVGFGYGVGVESHYTTDNASAKWVDNASYYFGSPINHTFIEDCYFEGCRHSVIGYAGSHFVVRNSTFDKMYVGYGSGHIDQHGAYENPGGSYGGHTYEVYNCTFMNSYSEYNASRYQFAGLKIRGGNGIYTQNTLMNYTWAILLSDESGNDDYPHCEAKWNYLVNNTFIGCSYWHGVEEGTWSEDNTTAINYTRAFLPAGWTPYTYPHPLRSGALTPPTSKNYVTWFFSDYENDDPEWDGITEQGSGTSVDLNATDVVYAGSQSGKYEFPAGSNIGAYSYENFNATFYNVSLSGWINTNTTASWRRWVELRNESDGSNLFTLLSSYSPDWRIYYVNGSSATQSDSTFSFSANQWNYLETFHFFNETNGYHKVYLNDTLVFNVQNLNNSVLRGGVRGMRIGAPTMSDTYTNTTIWMDNINFSICEDEFPVWTGIEVHLNQPAHTQSFNATEIVFNATISWTGTAAQNCSLWLNVSGTWQSVQLNTTTIENQTKHSITYNFTVQGTYIWNIQAYNTTHAVFASANRTVTAQITITYPGSIQILLSDGGQFGIQQDFRFLYFTAESNMNLTNCALTLNAYGGSLTFIPENNSLLTLTFVSYSKVKVNGSEIQTGTTINMTASVQQIISWEILIEAWLPIMFIFGMIGLVCMFFGGLNFVDKMQKKDYVNAFIVSTIAVAIGLSFVLAWLWT